MAGSSRPQSRRTGSGKSRYCVSTLPAEPAASVEAGTMNVILTSLVRGDGAEASGARGGGAEAGGSPAFVVMGATTTQEGVTKKATTSALLTRADA
jgi:hypothetical protein